jgi:23S rRNA (adenine2503-C2)-methyltransferase
VPARLAWSVHAAQDEVRRQLVPTTRHTMAELRDAFGEILANRTGEKGVFVECALVAGINDRPEHARALIELLAPLPGKTRVNLLPYNPFAPDTEGLNG